MIWKWHKSSDSSTRRDLKSDIAHEDERAGCSLANSLKNLATAIVGVIIAFIILEIFTRSFDPYPYFPYWEINSTEHGNLSQFDPLLGWRGVPSSAEWFITDNARVLVEHNKQGFRDIESSERSPDKPAIVFLGDSFTWGYEVPFEDMFVNIVRRRTSDHEIYNLAHRGYGTDQSLLTFREWTEHRRIETVILMFSENDFADNETDFNHRKPKPKFNIVDDTLVLDNLPIPKIDAWDVEVYKSQGPSNLKDIIKLLLFQSHFLHDLNFRLKLLRDPIRVEQIVEQSLETPPLDLTKRLLKELKAEVEERGGHFIVIAIPSKIQFMELKGFLPYQRHLRALCEELEVEFLDLAPYFANNIRRAHFRSSLHWNSYGNRIAADAISEYLETNGDQRL